MQSEMTIHVPISKGRRLVCYAEGGCQQEAFVNGPGWVLADDEEWPDAVLAVARATELLCRIGANLSPEVEWPETEPLTMEQATMIRVGNLAGADVGYCEHCPSKGGYCCVCGGGPVLA